MHPCSCHCAVTDDHNVYFDRVWALINNSALLNFFCFDLISLCLVCICFLLSFFFLLAFNRKLLSVSVVTFPSPRFSPCLNHLPNRRADSWMISLLDTSILFRLVLYLLSLFCLCFASSFHCRVYFYVPSPEIDSYLSLWTCVHIFFLSCMRFLCLIACCSSSRRFFSSFHFLGMASHGNMNRKFNDFAMIEWSNTGARTRRHIWRIVACGIYFFATSCPTAHRSFVLFLSVFVAAFRSSLMWFFVIDYHQSSLDRRS